MLDLWIINLFKKIKTFNESKTMKMNKQFLLLSLLFTSCTMYGVKAKKDEVKVIKKLGTNILLERYKAKYKARCKAGKALTMAVRANDSKKVDNLLKLGKLIDVDVKARSNPFHSMSQDTLTPLMDAVSSNNLPMVIKLVKAGADINVCYDAREKMDEDYDEDRADLETLPHIAINKGNHKILEYVLQKGANSNIPSLHGEYPIHYTFYHATKKTDSSYKTEISLLKKNGCDLNKKSKHSEMEGVTAAHQSCINNKATLIPFLKEEGVDFTATTDDGRTPLHYLALRNSEDYAASNELYTDGASEIVNSLKQDIDKVDNSGDTALMIAAVQEDYPLCTSLIAAGANESVRNNKGKTISSIIENHGKNMNDIRPRSVESSFGSLQL